MGLFLEELEVGAKYASVGRTVTEADLVLYSGLSGDYNPLHTDEEFARATPYGARIAHGPLVLAMAMGLVNRIGITDGTSLGFLAISNWQFKGPVYIGDTIHISLTVTNKRASSKAGRGVLFRRVEVINQRGEIVQEGEMVGLVKSRTEEVVNA